jgi:hypothetical protein
VEKQVWFDFGELVRPQKGGPDNPGVEYSFGDQLDDGKKLALYLIGKAKEVRRIAQAHAQKKRRPKVNSELALTRSRLDEVSNSFILSVEALLRVLELRPKNYSRTGGEDPVCRYYPDCDAHAGCIELQDGQAIILQALKQLAVSDEYIARLLRRGDPVLQKLAERTAA